MHTHTRTHARAHTRTLARTRAHTHTHTHARANTHTQQLCSWLLLPEKLNEKGRNAHLRNLTQVHPLHLPAPPFKQLPAIKDTDTMSCFWNCYLTPLFSFVTFAPARLFWSNVSFSLCPSLFSLCIKLLCSSLIRRPSYQQIPVCQLKAKCKIHILPLSVFPPLFISCVEYLSCVLFSFCYPKMVAR